MLETLKNLLTVEDTTVFQQYVNPYIKVNHLDDSITFKIQNGPIKVVGKNGVQLTALIEVAKVMLIGLNEKFPCEENFNTIKYLNLALEEQKKRTADRERRNVEGTNNE